MSSSEYQRAPFGPEHPSVKLDVPTRPIGYAPPQTLAYEADTNASADAARDAVRVRQGFAVDGQRPRAAAPPQSSDAFAAQLAAGSRAAERLAEREAAAIKHSYEHGGSWLGNGSSCGGRRSRR